jgi:hypothetical protein
MSSRNPEQESALQTGNRLNLLQALQGLGAAQIQVRYGGREGQCTHCLVSTTPADALLTFQASVVTQHRIDHRRVEEQIARLSLMSALKEFALHWVKLEHPRWMLNEGGSGVMTIDPISRQFTLEHDVYLTESFRYRLID